MAFYTIEQKGVPGKRLVIAEKPAGALKHVVDDLFTVKRVEGQELLDAAKECGDAEVAGAEPPKPQEEQQQAETQTQGEDDLGGGQSGEDGNDDNQLQQ